MPARGDGPTAGEVAEAYAIEAARRAWIEHRGVYGARRLTAQIRSRGLRWNRKRVARLMRIGGIEGVHRRRRSKYGWRTASTATAADPVERNFTAPAPSGASASRAPAASARRDRLAHIRVTRNRPRPPGRWRPPLGHLDVAADPAVLLPRAVTAPGKGIHDPDLSPVTLRGVLGVRRLSSRPTFCRPGSTSYRNRLIVNSLLRAGCRRGHSSVRCASPESSADRGHPARSRPAPPSGGSSGDVCTGELPEIGRKAPAVAQRHRPQSDGASTERRVRAGALLDACRSGRRSAIARRPTSAHATRASRGGRGCGSRGGDRPARAGLASTRPRPAPAS